MTLTMVMIGIVIVFFHVPFVGSIVLFLISISISLLAIVGVGLYISSICNTQQQAILSVMTFMMPAVLLSGFISPIEDMPLFLQYLTYLNPVRFFMVLSRGIILKGMGISDVIVNIIPLLVIATITLTLASRTFKRKLG
jgi:ABC-2 type transport system permease protein